MMGGGTRDGGRMGGYGGAGDCPTLGSEVSVRAVDIEGGAALELVSKGDEDAGELRQHVRAMADMHNRRQEQGGGFRMVESRASVQELEEGSRLIFLASDPAQVETLRQQVRARAERMREGGCHRMHGGRR